MAELNTIAAQFHFLRPWCLGFFIPLAALWLLMTYRTATRSEWHKVLAPELAELLIGKTSGKQPNLRPWILILGAIAIIALAGPTWSKKAMPVHKAEQALVILFDLSPSMLASDLKPDRLTRARLKTIDLLNQYKEGNAALVAFAGDAHVVTPLTDDAKTIISQLPVLHPNIMPVSGSNPEAALNQGLSLLENAGLVEGDILFVTDGLPRDAIENIHDRLKHYPAIHLSILGVGTRDGAPIPLNQYGFARDGNGGIVIAKLNDRELRILSRDHQGIYQTITGTDRDIESILAPLKSRSTDQARELERQLDIWQDQGFWLVIILLPFGVLLFRRGLLTTLILGTFTLTLSYTPESHADWWQDLWQTPDQQGLHALENQQPDVAKTLFNDPSWQGVAAHRAQDFESAAKAFAQKDNADSYYNQGNALAMAGKLDDAIKAYNKALEQEPDMEDAIFNKNLLQQMKQQQNEQPPQQEQNSESQNQQNENQQSSSGEQNDQQSEESNQDQQHSQGANSSQQQQKNQPPGQDQQDLSDNAHEQQDSDKPQAQDSDKQQPLEPEHDQTDSQKQNTSDQTSKQSEPADQESAQQQSVSQAEEDQSKNPEQQAAETWLRRVPDDPGGLLREKFKYQADQRFREERASPKPPPGQFSEERW